MTKTNEKLNRCRDSSMRANGCHRMAELHVFHTQLVLLSSTRDHRMLQSRSTLACR